MSDEFTPATKPGRQRRTENKAQRTHFDTQIWPSLRQDHSAYAKKKFMMHQRKLDIESQSSYDARVQVAVDAALRKFDATRESAYVDYVRSTKGAPPIAISGAVGGATLGPVPAELRGVLPLPISPTKQPIPAKKPVEKKTVAPSTAIGAVDVTNSFAALGDDEE